MDVNVTPLVADHRDGLRAFFGRIPDEDRTFFKEDVADAATVERWVTDPGGGRWVAVAGDEIVGAAALIPGFGWSSHVGELRLVVDHTCRRMGLGRTLSRTALLAAVEMGLAKIVVDVLTDQEPAVQMFQAIGFEPEALLRDHVRDGAGQTRDLIVLAHSIDDRGSELVALGIADAVGAGD